MQAFESSQKFRKNHENDTIKFGPLILEIPNMKTHKAVQVYEINTRRLTYKHKHVHVTMTAHSLMMSIFRQVSIIKMSKPK
jgi:hypothetical protein